MVAERQICALGDREDARGHLDSLAQAALADAAQAAELEAVGRHQQVLRHGHIQIGTLQLLCTKPSLQDYWASPCLLLHLHGKQMLSSTIWLLEGRHGGAQQGACVKAGSAILAYLWQHISVDEVQESPEDRSADVFNHHHALLPLAHV